MVYAASSHGSGFSFSKDQSQLQFHACLYSSYSNLQQRRDGSPKKSGNWQLIGSINQMFPMTRSAEPSCLACGWQLWTTRSGFWQKSLSQSRRQRQSVTSFIPTLVTTFEYSKIKTLLLVAPPYVFAAIVAMSVSISSDKRAGTILSPNHSIVVRDDRIHYWGKYTITRTWILQSLPDTGRYLRLV